MRLRDHLPREFHFAQEFRAGVRDQVNDAAVLELDEDPALLPARERLGRLEPAPAE